MHSLFGVTIIGEQEEAEGHLSHDEGLRENERVRYEGSGLATPEGHERQQNRKEASRNQEECEHPVRR